MVADIFSVRYNDRRPPERLGGKGTFGSIVVHPGQVQGPLSACLAQERPLISTFKYNSKTRLGVHQSVMQHVLVLPCFFVFHD